MEGMGGGDAGLDDYVLLRSMIDDSIDAASARLAALGRRIEEARDVLRTAEREVSEVEKGRRRLEKRRRAVADAISRGRPIPLTDEEAAQIQSRRRNAEGESAFLTDRSGRRTDVGGSIVVGREEGCGLVVRDMTVSRRHARVFRENGSWWVEDLGSKNGVRVDGRLVEPGAPSRLPQKAVVRLGAAALDFSVERGGGGS